MQIEEGKFYKNRAGDKVGPMAFIATARGPFCWWDKDKKSYTNDGVYAASFGLSRRDLIEEWEEPAALPPATEADGGWGDWQDGRMSYQPHAVWENDYREECINGVWRWQSRPRKHVEEVIVVYVLANENPRKGTFPETIKGLPKEANELRLGHMRGAPTMNYVREDVVEELRRKAKVYDEFWGPTYG